MPEMLIPLPRSFFNRPTLTVARELLGASVFCNGKRGVINETEAYIGQDDPACHAARGRTKRTEVMFWQAGYSYVYLIYGMYYCLNVVTEAEGFPAAVLIRGVLTEDVPASCTDGPGKLCRYFDITKEHNGVDIAEGGVDGFYLAAAKGRKLPDYSTTSRIGISRGKEHPWRFVAEISK